MAAIMGVHPHQNAVDVFLEKTGKAEPFEGNEFTYWGTVLEPAIAQRYAEENGVELVESDTLVHPKHPWLMATPDRIVKVDPGRGLECKNRGAYNVDAWGNPGSDEVPDEVAIQCHTNMEVTKLPRWDAAVLVGGNNWQSFVLEYDKEIAEAIVDAAHDFWFNYVQANICPELDGSESSTNYVARKWKTHNDLLVPATPEIAATAEELREIRALLKEHEEDEERLKNLLKDFIGDQAGVSLPTGKNITWKRPKPRRKTKWEALAKALQGHVSKDVWDDLLNTHTEEQQTARRFLYPRNW
jgi:putative phage-type endonuclease